MAYLRDHLATLKEDPFSLRESAFIQGFAMDEASFAEPVGYVLFTVKSSVMFEFIKAKEFEGLAPVIRQFQCRRCDATYFLFGAVL